MVVGIKAYQGNRPAISGADNRTSRGIVFERQWTRLSTVNQSILFRSKRMNRIKALLKLNVHLGPQTSDPSGDSGLARIGQGMIRTACFLKLIEPVVLLVVMLGMFTISSFGQTPGGNVFNGSDQTLGNGLKEFTKYFRNALFLGGVVFTGWGMVNLAMEKPWGTKMLGGLGCFGFSGIAALAYSFSQGNAVNLDTNLGN